MISNIFQDRWSSFRANSTLLKDISSEFNSEDKSMISRKQIEYLENRKEREVPESLGNLYFNLANGYYYLTETRAEI